ncbi:MAG: nucleotidyltransferase family protein [Pseudomonadota bacterium]
MKTVEQIRAAIRQHQEVLVERYGVKVVGLFGSYARGEHRKRSDLDLLVDIVRPISLLELIGAELYLSEVLGVKVDLIPKRGVREELRETIFREALSI